MNKCYICGCKLEARITKKSKNHKEHIIPQALGGHLDIGGILCKECGGEKYLGGEIDAEIAKLFKPITNRLNIKKDRKTTTGSIRGKLKPFLTEKEIKVNVDLNTISHQIPEYEIDDNNKKVYIFGNKTTVKRFQHKVLKELKEKSDKDYSTYEIELKSNLKGDERFDGMIEFPFNLNNKTLIKLLNKIAIEFALFKKVKYSQLEHLVDKENRTIKEDNNTLPYFPIELSEKKLEEVRIKIDPNFMSHSLVLFTQKYKTKSKKVIKELICFIELFGTFQFFVILNSNYKGKDIEPLTYSQAILKKEIPDLNLDNIKPDEISIHLDAIGKTYNDLKGKNYEETIKFFKSEYGKKNWYSFDYKENASRMVYKLSTLTIFGQDKKAHELRQSILNHFYPNQEFSIKNFRTQISSTDGLNSSLIYEILDFYKNNKEEVIKYTYSKFRVLEQFIDEQNK